MPEQSHGALIHKSTALPSGPSSTSVEALTLALIGRYNQFVRTRTGPPVAFNSASAPTPDGYRDTLLAAIDRSPKLEI